jgi:hypothetical protein
MMPMTRQRAVRRTGLDIPQVFEIMRTPMRTPDLQFSAVAAPYKGGLRRSALGKYILVSEKQHGRTFCV